VISPQTSLFKCSVQNCNMKLHYHEINNSKQIKLLKQKSNFQHDTLSHELNPCKIRMLESTYNDFVYCCKKGMKIYDFMLLHPEVNNLNITQLYDIRKIINKELNSAKGISEALKEYEEFSTEIIMDQQKRICEIVIINKMVMRNAYCDVLTIDDTVGVDTLDYPIECVIAKDANGKIQIAGFGYLANKTEEAFILFFQKFKELVEEERNKNGGKGNFGKIFVCDRLKAQSEAVRFVFEGCKIIYCKHHLMMDIERKYNMTNYILIKAAYDMFKYTTDENEYIKEVE